MPLTMVRRSMSLGSVEAQLAVAMVTLGGWFGDINPILTGLGTLCGIAYYLTQIYASWSKGND